MIRCSALVSLLVIVASSVSCSPRDTPAQSADFDVPGPRSTALAELDERERLVSDAIAGARESAVALEYSVSGTTPGARRVATGVIINREGDVVSVRIDRPTKAAPIVGRDASGLRLAVQWVAADRETGLTLLRIDATRARPRRPSTRQPGLGSEVLIVGNPFGLGHSVGRGSISGLNRRLELACGPLGGLIQVDAPLHPGDSGALVVDLRGEWLGLIRSGLAPRDSEHTTDHDLGFAITAEDALWVADQLHRRGRVDRAYLGVRLVPGRAGDPPGAVLDEVLENTAAARAGLHEDDRIVAFGDHVIQTPRDLTDRLDRTPADTDVVVDLLRSAQRVRLTVHTAQRPPREDGASSSPSTKGDDPSHALPREVAERIERLERRIRELEKDSGPRKKGAER
jgi:S1-C subfamily serine protease